MKKLLFQLIFWYLQLQLEKVRKETTTPYIKVNFTSKGKVRYLVYTDDLEYRKKCNRIW